MGQLVFQATLGGQVALVGPNTASTININIPATNGNMVTTGDTGTVTNTMLANSAITFGSTSQALGSTISNINGVNIGASTAGTGAFTTLSASSTVSGTGFSTYLASPPAIGGTTPAAITGTNVIATAGLYGKAAFSGSYTDGIVVDYTTGLGRISVGTSDGLAFYNAGVATTELMRLDASGNLGIGTSSPSSKLTIASSNVTVSAGYGIAYSGDQTRIMTPEDNVSGALIRWSGGGICRFLNGSTEVMRSDSSGNLLVGCTSLPSSTVSGQVLSGATSSYSFGSYTGAGNYIYFINGNGTVGKISSSGTTTTYSTSSDYRLKENVQPMTGALDAVAKLKPVTYDWISDKTKGQGFIAHELQSVVPECVIGEKDAVDADGKPVYQGIDTSFLVATLTAAIQEQQSIIQSLTARLDKAGL